jgi:hypothetical protein
LPSYKADTLPSARQSRKYLVQDAPKSVIDKTKGDPERYRGDGHAAHRKHYNAPRVHFHSANSQFACVADLTDTSARGVTVLHLHNTIIFFAWDRRPRPNSA